jgi:ubiquinol-cytochrome c reductase cytochrome c subunit
MKVRVQLLFVLAVLLVGPLGALRVAGQAQPPAPAERPAPAATPPGNAENGKKLFVNYGCYQCHGYEAQGSTATGPRLGPRPIAFAALSRYVRSPTGQMPPYTTKVLPDTDLADIYAFLQSRPQPPALESIQLLK